LDTERQPLLTVGDRVANRYRVESLIGTGGCAQVYRALQLDNGREVALKVLDISLNLDRGKELQKRFEREAQLAASFDHPNIVTVYDYGLLERGVPYMVLELLRGMSLSDYLQKVGPFSLSHACRLMVPALEALSMGHKSGVIHRDIKPGNIFVRKTPTRGVQLCVLDYGMAFLQVEHAVRLTQQGFITGTPAYMAPEYGSHDIITPAMDVYQMALVLVEMVSGKPTVSESHPWKCYIKHAKGQLDVPSVFWKSPIGPVLKKALRVDHTRRYQDAGQFRDALAEAVMELPADAQPEEVREPDPNAPSIPADPPSVSLPMSDQHEAIRMHPISAIRKLANRGSEPAPDPPANSGWSDAESMWEVEVDMSQKGTNVADWIREPSDAPATVTFERSEPSSVDALPSPHRDGEVSLFSDDDDDESGDDI
jgi:serine/threonine-protein kinase